MYKNIDLKNLSKLIDVKRKELNELLISRADSDNSVPSDQVLKVSRELDLLIVEYERLHIIERLKNDNHINIKLA